MHVRTLIFRIRAGMAFLFSSPVAGGTMRKSLGNQLSSVETISRVQVKSSLQNGRKGKQK